MDPADRDSLPRFAPNSLGHFGAFIGGRNNMRQPKALASMTPNVKLCGARSVSEPAWGWASSRGLEQELNFDCPIWELDCTAGGSIEDARI